MSDDAVMRDRIRAMIEGCGYSEAKKEAALRYFDSMRDRDAAKFAEQWLRDKYPDPGDPPRSRRPGAEFIATIERTALAEPGKEEWRLTFARDSPWAYLTIVSPAPVGSSLETLLYYLAHELAATAQTAFPPSLEGWDVMVRDPDLAVVPAPDPNVVLCWRCKERPGLVSTGVGNSSECIVCAGETMQRTRAMLEQIDFEVRDGLRSWPRIMDRVEFVRECIKLQREEAVRVAERGL